MHRQLPRFAGPGGAPAGIAIGPSGTLVSYVRIARNLVDGQLAAGALSAAFSIGTGDGVYPPAMIVEVSGEASSVVIDGNLLVRTSATPANVLNVTHVGSPGAAVTMTRTTIKDNVLLQPTAMNIAQLYSVSSLAFTGNYLGFSSSTTGTFIGVGVRAVTNPVVDVAIADNMIVGNERTGTLGPAIELTPGAAPQNDAIDRILIRGNLARGVVFGVKFDAGTYPGYPFVVDNASVASGADITGIATPVAVGGNLGGPLRLVGTGAPAASVSAPTGSLYTNRSGGAHTSLYVREGGTWKAR